jgi:DNA-binding MarR family transcriptional regulator
MKTVTLGSAKGASGAPRSALAEKRRKDEGLGEVLAFMRCVWALDHGLQSRSKQMTATMGITGPQRLAIRLVGQRPGISAGSLAQLLHVHPSTLTGVLRRLDERGFIARTSDPDDRRRSILELTTAGRSVDAQRSATVEASVKRTLARLAPGDVLATRRVLKRLARELEGADED